MLNWWQTLKPETRVWKRPGFVCPISRSLSHQVCPVRDYSALAGRNFWRRHCGKGEGMGFKWLGREKEQEWGKGEKWRKGLVGLTVWVLMEKGVGKEKGVRGWRGRENGQWGGNRKSEQKRINWEGEKENELLKVGVCGLCWESWCLLIVNQGACLQLLETLDIYWNSKCLLDILEISWNLIAPQFLYWQEWHSVIKFSCSSVIRNWLA